MNDPPFVHLQVYYSPNTADCQTRRLLRLWYAGNLIPINVTGIATDDLGDVLQGQGFGVDAKVLVELGVHLVLGQPKGEHGHLMGEVEQLNAIELIEPNHAVIDKQDFTLRRTLAL